MNNMPVIFPTLSLLSPHHNLSASTTAQTGWLSLHLGIIPGAGVVSLNSMSFYL